MTKTIFKSMLGISIAVLLACILCISYVLYGYFGDIIEDELKNEATLISRQIQNDENYLKDTAFIGNRVTLVDTDGTVLFDSQADEISMENHSGREEIKEAREEGEAFATRYSDTLSTKTIYYALELEDGRVLRIAQQQSVVMMLLRGVVEPIILIMLLIIILTTLISRVISRKIITPINEMDMNDADAEEPYPELAPLMGKIRQQNRHIRQQMEAMERKQREFTSITEHMSEGFLLIDRKMEILSYNKAAIDILGGGSMEIPHTALELNRSKSFRTAVEEVITGKHSQQPWETDNKYYHIIANPVLEEGQTAGAVIVIMDVTEKEQRDKLRREFTSNVSHELKTPLTTIYGVSDMMAGGIVKPEDVAGFAENIKEESGRMISLIDDIIKLSKLDEDAVPDTFTKIDLFDMAKDVVDRMTEFAKDKKVRLYLEGEPVVIKGIPTLCDEIIHNLCENAIKYNKENGSVTICVKNEREGAVISVEDTGIGIPYEYRDRVFERFFRVDKSHSQQVDGTGLGLSIVKHAVSHMGGIIEAESLEGAGTKMIVRLPRSASRFS